jgi:hypothetical protein
MDGRASPHIFPRQFLAPGTAMVRPLLLKPQWMNGRTERLLVSHYVKSYGGAVRRTADASIRSVLRKLLRRTVALRSARPGRSVVAKTDCVTGHIRFELRYPAGLKSSTV